jgi:hypothetical protein
MWMRDRLSSLSAYNALHGRLESLPHKKIVSPEQADLPQTNWFLLGLS